MSNGTILLFGILILAFCAAGTFAFCWTVRRMEIVKQIGHEEAVRAADSARCHAEYRADVRVQEQGSIYFAQVCDQKRINKSLSEANARLQLEVNRLHRIMEGANGKTV